MSSDLSISRPAWHWREQNGVISFSVTSNNMTGQQWIKHFESKDCGMSSYAKSLLRSPDFEPTNGVTYEIAVLKGLLFEGNSIITKDILAEAETRKLTKPNAEVACLIREIFSDEELEAMGLVMIVVMHEPIKDFDWDSLVLGAVRRNGRWLHAFYSYPGGWSRKSGFAFVISQSQG